MIEYRLGGREGRGGCGDWRVELRLNFLIKSRLVSDSPKRCVSKLMLRLLCQHSVLHGIGLEGQGKWRGFDVGGDVDSFLQTGHAERNISAGYTYVAFAKLPVLHDIGLRYTGSGGVGVSGGVDNFRTLDEAHRA